MKSKILLVLSAFTIVAASSDHQIKEQRRNSKLFPFLAVVSFPNTKCNDPMLGDGLCYTSSQCTRNGGVVSTTSCAQNYGVCCIFQQSCGGTPPMLIVRNNITQLVGAPNPNPPNMMMPITQPCQIKIPRQPGVCQVKLDFKFFEVGTAGADGNCPLDFVSFKSDNLPDGLMLCGVNSGRHLYLHYGQLDTLTINTNLVSTGSSYNIEVTMIKCDSVERAPDGCTQYYTSPTSEVQSFNFPVQQLNSQLYTVCVKRDIGQTIQWGPCPMPNNTFSISGLMFPPGNPMNVQKSGDQCISDYVFIPPGNKICGTNFTSTFTSNISPFFIIVNFDAGEVPVPSGPLDPTSGCPPGFICNDPDPVTMKCEAGGSCQAPDWYLMEGLIDAGNLGFCVRYSVQA